MTYSEIFFIGYLFNFVLSIIYFIYLLLILIDKKNIVNLQILLNFKKKIQILKNRLLVNHIFYFNRSLLIFLPFGYGLYLINIILKSIFSDPLIVLYKELEYEYEYLDNIRKEKLDKD